MDDVLTAFGDPKGWLSEGEKMDANKLRAIDAAMKRPLQSAQFVDSLMSYLDEVGADGPAAQEVRAQAERLRNGEQLGEREARNFWMSAQLARKAAGDKQALDAVLARHIDRRLELLSPVEHAVLLIGAYELRHCLDIPYRVCINEAVEVAKNFGGTDGHKYVNGVLDKAAAQLRPDEVAAARAARGDAAR